LMSLIYYFDVEPSQWISAFELAVGVFSLLTLFFQNLLVSSKN
jgi:hypothetical protein